MLMVSYFSKEGCSLTYPINLSLLAGLTATAWMTSPALAGSPQAALATVINQQVNSLRQSATLPAMNRPVEPGARPDYRLTDAEILDMALADEIESGPQMNLIPGLLIPMVSDSKGRF